MLDQSVDFIGIRRLLIVVAALNTLVHLSHRRLTLLRSELHEQLVAVVQCHLAPHGIKLLFQNLLIHTVSHRVLTQLVLFFQVVVDQAVCRTLERVVCSIWPHRVFCAVHWEEHVCDVFNVERTLGLIAFTSSFSSHSKRVVDVSLHRVDEVELHNLESTHGCTDVVLHQELTLRIIDDHVVWTLLTHPDVKHRLNVRLTLTGTSHSKNHGVRRSCIHVVDASRTLWLIRWKFPFTVHQISQGIETLELISVGIAWVVRHVTRIETATELLVIRQSRCVPQDCTELFVKHRHHLGHGIAVIVRESFTLKQSHIAILVKNVLGCSLRKSNLLDALVRDHRVRNESRCTYASVRTHVRHHIEALTHFFRECHVLVILVLIDVSSIPHEILRLEVAQQTHTQQAPHNKTSDRRHDELQPIERQHPTDRTVRTLSQLSIAISLFCRHSIHVPLWLRNILSNLIARLIRRIDLACFQSWGETPFAPHRLTQLFRQSLVLYRVARNRRAPQGVTAHGHTHRAKREQCPHEDEDEHTGNSRCDFARHRRDLCLDVATF